MSGKTLLVGARSALTAEEPSGAAYLFVHGDDGWQEQFALGPSAPLAAMDFGGSVAIADTDLLVGARGDPRETEGKPGSVYVFSRTTGLELQQLGSGAEDGEFGEPIAVSGDTALIAAPQENHGAGAVYVVERVDGSWQFVQRLAPSPAGAYEQFGLALSLSTTAAAVTAIGAGGPEVVLFERQDDSWTQTETLGASAPWRSPWWGLGLAMDEQQLLVGDPYAGVTEWGAVDVFSRELGWQPLESLVPSLPSTLFGRRLAIETGWVIVSSRAAAYVFSRDDGVWVEREVLEPDDPDVLGDLAAVSVSNGTFGVGAPAAGARGAATAGAVFVFGACARHDQCPEVRFCSEDGRCREKLPNGSMCTVGFGSRQCRSGHCIDGLCCDSACDQSCEACAEPEHEGRCIAVRGTPRGDREGCGSDTTCGGRCDGHSRTCNYPPSGTICGSRCEDGGGVITTCDGTGACSEEDTRDCGAYACLDGACRTVCEYDGDCAGGSSCVSGSCVALPASSSCAEDGNVSLGPFGTRDCGAYRCDVASGACLSACSNSAQCAPEHVCDTLHRNCVLEAAKAPLASGCSCRAAAGARTGAWLPALLLGMLGWRRRRGAARQAGRLAVALALSSAACAPTDVKTEGSTARSRQALASDVVWVSGQVLTGGYYFGRSLATSGSTLLVGGPESATFFTRSEAGWQPLQEVEPPQDEDNSCSGDSVALEGDTALIGSMNGARLLTRSESGGVFSEVGRLVAEGGDSSIGCIVRLRGDRAAIANSSSTVLFERIDGTWQQGQTLSGAVKALNDSRVFARKAFDGQLYVYSKIDGGWELETTLLTPTDDNYDQFGMEAVADDTTLVVGDNGYAYAYDLSQSDWEPQVLETPILSARPEFGVALALSGNVLLIGDPEDSAPIPAAAHVFRGAKEVWAPSHSVFYPQANVGTGWYGTVVAVGDDELFVSATEFLPEGHDAWGAVFVYGRCASDQSCPEAYYCAADEFCHPQKEAGQNCDAAGAGDCREAGCRVCASGHCADGVCCDRPCASQCEACAEPGSEGQCVLVSGQPRGGRAACAGEGELCQGVCTGEQAACIYPSAVPCGGSCKEGQEIPEACDGQGACVAGQPRACLGYACGETSCLTSCSGDDECLTGYACEDTRCLPRAPYECSEDRSASLSDGATIDCGTYLCDPSSGECRRECVATSDCAPGFVCDVEPKTCVPADTAEPSDPISEPGLPPALSPTAASNTGCACAAVVGANVTGRALAAASAMVCYLAWRRRRRQSSS